jgi:hypothetical protein
MRKSGIFVWLILILYFPLKTTAQLNSVTAPVPLNYTEHWLFTEPADTINGNWNYITPLQNPLFGSASYYLENMNKVFICGGTDSLGNPNAACYFYNVQTNSFEAADSLPAPRAYGKLVKVRDSLYLVGSVLNFNSPDGALYKYNPSANNWTIKSPFLSPVAHEMAVCVWNDSLIIAVGGSTSGFGGSVSTVRIYDPFTDSWRVLSGAFNIFPAALTAPQAECIGNLVILAGGYGLSNASTRVFKGYIYSNMIDSLAWREDTIPVPFGTGIYRLGGGKFGSFLVFGPGLSTTACINQLWGFNLFDSTWIRFYPNTIDIAARTSLAVKHTADSLYFFLFGGITRDTAGTHFIKTSEKFAAGNPVIGISGNNNNIPAGFVLNQNYPNPFNPVTTIEYTVPVRSIVTLKIYDVLGKEIAVIVNELKSDGKYTVKFDGGLLASGIYFYRLTASDASSPQANPLSIYFSETRKMILLK